MSDDLNLEYEPKTDAGTFSDEYVQATEEMLALEFPAEFIEFLRIHNGGVPKKQYFKLDENTKVVERFLCLFPEYEENEAFGQFDIGVVWSQIEDRLNDYLVPFAAVFTGDFLCFNYEESKNPAVVLWDHDLSDEDNPVTYPVADNFRQFLSMLTDDAGN